MGFAPTTKKNVMGVPSIKVTPHEVNLDFMRAFQSMISSIVDSVQTFHATSKLDTLTPIILKAREMQ